MVIFLYHYFIMLFFLKQKRNIVTLVLNSIILDIIRVNCLFFILYIYVALTTPLFNLFWFTKTVLVNTKSFFIKLSFASSFLWKRNLIVDFSECEMYWFLIASQTLGCEVKNAFIFCISPAQTGTVLQRAPLCPLDLCVWDPQRFWSWFFAEGRFGLCLF